MASECDLPGETRRAADDPRPREEGKGAAWLQPGRRPRARSRRPESQRHARRPPPRSPRPGGPPPGGRRRRGSRPPRGSRRLAKKSPAARRQAGPRKKTSARRPARKKTPRARRPARARAPPGRRSAARKSPARKKSAAKKSAARKNTTARKKTAARKSPARRKTAAKKADVASEDRRRGAEHANADPRRGGPEGALAGPPPFPGPPARGCYARRRAARRRVTYDRHGFRLRHRRRRRTASASHGPRRPRGPRRRGGAPRVPRLARRPDLSAPGVLASTTGRRRLPRGARAVIGRRTRGPPRPARGLRSLGRRGACRRRSRSKPTIFLLLHDDVALDPDAVTRLVEATMIPGVEHVGIVGAKIVDWDRPRVLRDVGRSADRFGHPFSSLQPDELDQGQFDRVLEVLTVDGCAMLIARDAWQQVRLVRRAPRRRPHRSRPVLARPRGGLARPDDAARARRVTAPPASTRPAAAGAVATTKIARRSPPC